MIRIDQVVTLLSIAADLKDCAERAKQARQRETAIPHEMIELEEEAFAATKALHDFVNTLTKQPEGNVEPKRSTLPEVRKRRI